MSSNRLRTLVVVHTATGDRRALDVLRVSPREVELRWPLHGPIRFHVREGSTVGKRSHWRISPLSLAMLHRELKIVNLDPYLETEIEIQKAFA